MPFSRIVAFLREYLKYLYNHAELRTRALRPFLVVGRYLGVVLSPRPLRKQRMEPEKQESEPETGNKKAGTGTAVR